VVFVLLQACIMMMRNRLFHAQGEGGAAEGQQPPPFPYNRVRVTGGDPAPAQAPAVPVQAQPPTQTPVFRNECILFDPFATALRMQQ
jgi:hypothetical protein